MGIANRLKKERRAARSTLKEVAEAPVFFFASDDGNVIMREEKVSGRDMNVTYAYASHGAAKDAADEYRVEWDQEIHVRNMPVGTFLAFLFHHLGQADIDIVLSDKEKPYPLTTLGVNVLQDPVWAEALKQARLTPSKNVLLAKVARDLLTVCGGPGATLATASVDYATLVRVITGNKRAVLPTVDLGLVWFMVVAQEGTDGEVEPLLLKISGADDKALHDHVDNLSESALDPEGEVIVGPLCFTTREAALNWAKILPPHIAAHLMGLDIMLTADRGVEFLTQIRNQFPSYRVEDVEPDAFVFDGGILPLTLAGAGYVESKIDYKDMGFDKAPERNWLSVAEGQFTAEGGDGEQMCRNMVINVVARDLGIQIVDPNAEVEPESLIATPEEDEALTIAAVENFMKTGTPGVAP